MKKNLSPFDQAMKEFGEVLFGDFDIRKEYKQSLLILLGTFTAASKLPKKSRDWLSIHMAMHNITKQVKGSDLLEPIWKCPQPIFLQTLIYE